MTENRTYTHRARQCHRTVRIAALASALVATGFGPQLYAQHAIDAEGAYVVSGDNHVRIPGDTGTHFSLTDDLHADRPAAFRIRYSHTFAHRHWVGVLVAPLRVTSHGTLTKNVDFNGTFFPQGTPVNATFRFNSYRLIYRALFHTPGRWQLGLGGALKVRDAAIKLESAGRVSERKNTGVVPLLSFLVRWSPFSTVHLLVDGEALAAPQGRAEDVLFAVQQDLSKRVSLKAGYRLLEGGADNDDVYTFSLFHQIVAGLAITF